MSDEIKNLIRMYLSDGLGHQAKYIKNYVKEHLDVKPRIIEYHLTELIKDEEIERTKQDNSPYQLYQIKHDNIKRTSSHQLYINGTKGEIFQSQSEISNVIKKINDDYKQKLKKDVVKNSSFISNYIIGLLQIHKKITFAELSYWFGDSKNEKKIASKNKEMIEKIIQQMFTDVAKTNEDTWHSMIHIIHDIIDEDRVWTKPKTKILFGY